MISAITEVYTQAIASFLPTPSKSHYVFNLRDFARVVQVRVSQFVIHFFFSFVCCTAAILENFRFQDENEYEYQI